MLGLVAPPLQRLATILAAPWLRGRFGGGLLEATGLTLDVAHQRLYEAMANSLPFWCDVSALPWHAQERDIRLYSTEPIWSQRYRLSRWLQIHRYRGTDFGLMANIQPFFLGALGLGALPTIKVVHQSGTSAAYPTATATWHTLTPYNGAAGFAGLTPLPPLGAGTYTITPRTTSNFNFDGQTSKWSRVFVIIHLPPRYSTEITYDSGHTYGDGSIYDGITSIAIQDLVAGLKEAKAVHTRISAVIVTTLQPTDSIPGFSGRHPFDPNDVAITLADGSTSLPTGNWGGLLNPGATTPSRPPWASFVYVDNP